MWSSQSLSMARRELKIAELGEILQNLEIEGLSRIELVELKMQIEPWNWLQCIIQQELRIEALEVPG